MTLVAWSEPFFTPSFGMLMSIDSMMYSAVIIYAVATSVLLLLFRYKLSKCSLGYLLPFGMVVVTAILIIWLGHADDSRVLERLSKDDRNLFADVLKDAFLVIWSAALGASILLTGKQPGDRSGREMRAGRGEQAHDINKVSLVFADKELMDLRISLARYEALAKGRMFLLDSWRSISVCMMLTSVILVAVVLAIIFSYYIAASITLLLFMCYSAYVSLYYDYLIVSRAPLFCKKMRQALVQDNNVEKDVIEELQKLDSSKRASMAIYLADKVMRQRHYSGVLKLVIVILPVALLVWGYRSFDSLAGITFPLMMFAAQVLCVLWVSILMELHCRDEALAYCLKESLNSPGESPADRYARFGD